MADLKLISILPAQTVPGVSQPQNAAGSSSQASSTPPSFSPGTVLNGFVINRDSSGNPVLRTDSGDITFSSNYFLKIGSQVSIRFEAQGGSTSAHILSVDGQPPAVAEKLSAFAQEPNVIVGDHLSATPSNVTISGASAANVAANSASEPSVILNGTLISTPQQVTAPTLESGSQLTLKVVGLNAVPTGNPPVTAAPAASSLPGSPVSLQSPQTNSASYAAYSKVSAATPGALVAFNPSSTTAFIPGTPTTPIIAVTAGQSSPLPVSIANQDAGTAVLVPVAGNAGTVQVQPEGSITPNTLAVTQPGVVTEPVVTQNIVVTPQSSVLYTESVVIAPSGVIVSEPASQQNFPQNLSGQVISATVIANENSGESLVQTPLGIVRLDAGNALPNGSKVQFEIISTLSASSLNANPLQARALSAAPLRELAQQWTSLEEIFTLLSGHSTLTGLDALLAVPNVITANNNQPNLPSATPQSISNGLLLFIAAMRGADFSNWLGNSNAKWLQENGHIDVLKKAEAEFMSLSRQFTEVRPHQWQTLFFPVAVDGILHQVRMFTKRDRRPAKDTQSKEDEDTRFVIEVDLSQLGELQMDGFVRRQEKNLYFDMVIRSVIPLSEQTQHDILKIYNDTGQLTGFKGSLSFQAVKEFPVNPMEDIIAETNTFLA